MTHFLFIRILPVNSHFASSLWAGSPIQFGHVRLISRAPAPNSGRLSYLLHSGIPYSSVIYIHVTSLPLSRTLCYQVPGDGHLPIADLGDVDNQPADCAGPYLSPQRLSSADRDYRTCCFLRTFVQ